MDQHFSCELYQNNGSFVRSLELKEVPQQLLDKDCFVWLGVYNPTDAHMESIKEAFGLHELAVEDASTAHQRAKIETMEDSVFMVLRTAKLSDNELKVSYGQIGIFLSERYVVTVRRGLAQDIGLLRKAVQNNPTWFVHGPLSIAHALIDQAVDAYLPITDALRDYVSQVESSLFSKRFDVDTLRKLYDLKSQLIQLRSVVAPHQDICNYFLNHTQGHALGVKLSRIKPYFRDVHDHILRVLDAVTNSSEMISAAMETYTTAVSMQQNIIVRKLAAWAAILAVPTLMTSVYGMNFEHMPELALSYSYPVFLCVMLAVSVVLWRSFRKIGWL